MGRIPIFSHLIDTKDIMSIEKEWIIDSVEDVKKMLFEMQARDTQEKHPRNPTRMDGDSLNRFDTWLNTETDEYFILVYRTDKGNFWHRINKFIDKIAHGVYNDLHKQNREHMAEHHCTCKHNHETEVIS